MTLIRIKTGLTKSWSGGDTTELYISPFGADYGLRNFDFRLSTATVEIEESLFTALPGISRSLMVLEGEMELIHENHHQIRLLPLHVDHFMGGWKTESIGTCVDFNLMTRNGVVASLEGLQMNDNESIQVTVTQAEDVFVYVYRGIVCLNINEDEISVDATGMVKISVTEAGVLSIGAIGQVVLAKVVVTR